MTAGRPLRLLTIAGSDSGGGAGLQADLKTFAAHGAFGMSVVTSITAQNTRGVSDRFDLPAALVGSQLEAVLADLPPDAIKIGMLGSSAIAARVAATLAAAPGRAPVVLDPVVVAGSGDPLLDDDAVATLLERLLPLATIVTPNLPEARRLTGLGPQATADALGAALAARGVAVLLKGGHGTGPVVEDLLFASGRVERFRAPRLRREKVHGTGCTLASALAVRLARGQALGEAAAGAIGYVRRAIGDSRRLGGGLWVLLHPPEAPP